MSRSRLLAVTIAGTVPFAILTGCEGASRPGPDQAEIERFVLADGYTGDGWVSQAGHLSGALVDGVDYTVHGWIEVHYSPEIATWLGEGKPVSGVPDNAMVVALERVPPAEAGGEPGELRRILSMVRSGGGERGGPFDGWYWSTIALEPGSSGQRVDRASSQGGFGLSACFACHGAADNGTLVFLSDGQPAQPTDWQPDDGLKWKDPPASTRSRIQPRAAADPEFLRYFELSDVAAADVVPFPAKQHDRVWAGRYAGPDGNDKESFITSDQCMGCHNAGQLLSNTSPNMWYPEPNPATALVDGARTPDSQAFRNFSPYGEWSASLNALSGRDPVWHAQVDFERKLRPELADFTTDTCFLCHGPMAQRQIKLDRGPDALFTIDMFYDVDGENAKYGALARDGVSCAVCHQIGSPELGVDPEFRPWQPIGVDSATSGYFLPTDFKTFTAMFPNPYIGDDLDSLRNPYRNSYFGPYPNTDIQSILMDQTIGQSGRWGAGDAQVQRHPQIHESKLCGSCHTVLVPALPVGYQLPDGVASPFHDPNMKMSFEQTTYFEWRNSMYENEQQPFRPTAITCQGCHMASHADPATVGGTSPATPLAERIVNSESDRFPPVRGRAPDQSLEFTRKPQIYRHVLLGINYFVFEMYEQFPDLLGAQHIDPRVPEHTLDETINARDWIENHAAHATAEVRITAIDEGSEHLEVEVEVTNFAGHKFPTGAGFRRAFIQFEVLGQDDEVLWASGRVSPLGVLLGADGQPLASEETVVPGQSQPHHLIITGEDQVQIYETRALNSGVPGSGGFTREPELQTTVLGIYYEYKDNRILPIGWAYEHPPYAEPVLVGDPANQPPGAPAAPSDAPEGATEHGTVYDNGMRPFHVVYDPDYWSAAAANGQDHVRYRVPLSAIEGWTRVRARLYYQTIPPYYLRDRFQTALPANQRFPKERDMNRLIHMASRLNLDGSPAENWSLAVAAPAEKARGAPADARLTRADALAKLRGHYVYLSLPPR